MSAPEMKFAMAPSILAAAVERRGPYSTVGDTMRRLKEWIDSKGIEQAGHPFCLYFDNPSETPAEELRSVVCIPVAKPFNPEGETLMKRFPEVQVAETRHEGPPVEFAGTYGPFLEGLLNSGFNIVGPAREFYKTVSDVTGPGAGFLIQQPIEKK